jgi:hypothetical protein
MPNIGAVKSCSAPTQHKGKSEQDFAAPTGSAIATQQRGAILVNPYRLNHPLFYTFLMKLIRVPLVANKQVKK